MLTVTAALLLAAVSAPPQQPVIYQFSAPWCTTCREVEPQVQRLRAAGVPIEKLNVDEHREFVEHAKIEQIPCFVIVHNDQELDRRVGSFPAEELWDWYQATSRLAIKPVGRSATSTPHDETRRTNLGIGRASCDPTTGICKTAPMRSAAHIAKQNSGNPSASAASQLANPAIAQSPQSANSSAIERAIAATVRLKIKDAEGHSLGTGTIIDVHDDEALVLTCGHIFRESRGQGQISCDLFTAGRPRDIPGKLISYDMRRDVGLVSIRPGIPIAPILVGGTGSRAETDQAVFSVGCNRGADPTIIQSRILAVNRYHGPANLVVGGRPIDGRSGGGLFDANGKLIGVCNAADPDHDEGLYAALDNVHTELNMAGLACIYQKQIPGLPPALMTSEVSQVPPAPLRGHGVDASQPTPTEKGGPAGSELICILRSRTQAAQREQMFVLDRPSKDLLSRLSQEANRRSASAEVNMHVPHPEPPTSNDADGWRSLPLTSAAPHGAGQR